MNEPICPCCNVELVRGDCFDTTITDDYVKIYVTGFCPKCDKEFQWSRKYSFVEITELREDY